MVTTLHICLHKPSMHADVRHLVGQPAGLEPDGVSAWLWSDGGRHLALIADSPGNLGVSATNGFEAYAAALMAYLDPEAIGRVRAFEWFEFDSTAMFDRVTLSDARAKFSPVLHPGSAPRSPEAFLACVGELAPESISFWNDITDLLCCSQSVRAGL